MTAIAFEMQERGAPSRSYRLGTRRRRPRADAALPTPGASRFAERKAPSLDTGKQLATTVANWMADQETDWDKYSNRVRLWRQLLCTVHQIWQDWYAKLWAEPESRWWQWYEDQKGALAADECPDYDAWLEKLAKKKRKEGSAVEDDQPSGLRHVNQSYYHALYLEHLKKTNKPVGKCAQILGWEKQYFQLLRCEGEWIGYKAECCDGQTRPVAVPIGCNHRLCPLCGWHRSQKARRRMKTMFDRLIHPVFITLTVPNVPSISKHTFHGIRKKVRQFLAQHKEQFPGGVYAIETTYNRTERTWHVHAHVLADQAFKMPRVDQRVRFAGRNIPAFTLIKLSLEFDWSRLWLNVRDESGKWANPLGMLPRRNASKMVREGERWEFENWVRDCWANSLKEYDWRTKSYVAIDLPEHEIERRTEWNKGHRRVLDIKPVTDREKAAKEVLKYITKSADFCDLPECVEAFYNAAKGARLIQTWGTWYGVDIDLYASAAHPEDWTELKCECGENRWVRMGLFQYRDVAMDPQGRWRLTREFDHNSAGTVPRPTIRALDSRSAREDFKYGNNFCHAGSEAEPCLEAR